MTSGSDLEKHTAARHEAGHALVAKALGYPVSEVRLVPPAEFAQWSGYGVLPASIPDADRLVITVAGAVADTSFENAFFDDPCFAVALEELPTANVQGLIIECGLTDPITPDAGPLDQATVLRLVAHLSQDEAAQRIRSAACAAQGLLDEPALDDLTSRLVAYLELNETADSAERRVYRSEGYSSDAFTIAS